MAKITIDGKDYEVDENNNLLEECLSAGLDLPYFCWHPAMGSVGSCRQCAVIEYAGADDTRGRLQMSCMIAPREGARYSIAAAHKFRADVIESLMINHPHDCPVCEEGGECHLQDMTWMSGHIYRRYKGKKKTHRNQYLGPFINHEMNRCITCYRCVRFYRDYAGGTDLVAQGSHDHTYFGRQTDGVLESEFSGNLAEVCPTGVFTDRPFSKRYVRKWDLQTAPSLCFGCSVGCNTNPGERYGSLRRVVNRFNDEINGYFICDRGRFGAGFVSGAARIPASMTRTSREDDPVMASTDEARAKLHKVAPKAIGIGSPRASMEANFALRELVGEDKFYAGVDDTEFAILQRILDIYESVPANIANIRDIENSDCVVVLGEDVTNTAARIALALRQAVRNKHWELAEEKKFPLWHDAAVRKLAMDAKSPLYILSPHATRIDDIARQVHIASAGESAQIANALAHALDAGAPAVGGLSQDAQNLVEAMAGSLKNARQPLIVSGTGSRSLELVEAAGNLATALSAAGRKANIALVSGEANSMGLALMLRGRPQNTLGAALASGTSAAVVLENDLYRRAPGKSVDTFINGLESLAVIDSVKNRTGEQANLVLAAATFAECSGTFVNYETRAQHFYSVFKPQDSIRSSAWWLSDSSLLELTEGCARVLHCEEMVHLTPGPGFNVAGLRAPRQLHRYSGRTAMLAHLSVHEPKATQDENGVMVYSMEGVPATRDTTVYNTAWAPGWNSNQSVFKFQEEIGGAIRQSSEGVHLVKGNGSGAEYFSSAGGPAPTGQGGEFEVFPVYHLFGSEELSSYTPAIQERATGAYLALSPADAEKLGVASGDGVRLQQNGSLPVLVRESLRPGTVGISVGLAGVNFQDLSAGVALEKAADWQAPESWKESNIIVSDKRSQ